MRLSGKEGPMKLRGEIPIVGWAEEFLAVNPRASFCLGPEIYSFSPERFFLRLEVELGGISFSFPPFDPAMAVSGLPKRVQKLCWVIAKSKKAESFNRLADALAKDSRLNIEENGGIISFVLMLDIITDYLVLTPVEIPAFLFFHSQRRPSGLACC